jgi:hypothetical protein
MTSQAVRANEAITADPLASTRRSSGIWRDTLRNILRQRNAVVGLILLGFMLFVAVFADVIATYPPDQVLIGVEQNVKKSSPPCIHLLGCPASGGHAWGPTATTSSAGRPRRAGPLFVGFVTVVGLHRRLCRRLDRQRPDADRDPRWCCLLRSHRHRAWRVSTPSWPSRYDPSYAG